MALKPPLILTPLPLWMPICAQGALCCLQLIDEYPDVAERIRVALSNKPTESGLMPILKISSTSIDAGASVSQTFASAAGNVKSGASYIGIRKDVMAFKSNGGSPVDMLRTVLTGPSSREPNRRSNAVMLSILHDSGSKLINIDPLFYFIQSHMELALPKLLGQTVGDALGYAHLADTPTQLKELAAIVSSLGANEALKLNLHLLAVIPCMKKRFPKQAASMVGLARPYASKEGLEDTLDVAVAVFGLLGCVDDSGSQQKAPYSVRAVWRKCIEAHKNFGRFDPLKMESATHAVISGMMVDYFKFGLNPARDGKNAEAIVPMYFCPNASEHLEGLQKLCANIEKKANRDAEDIIDVTVIPGAVDTGSGSDAALSGAQKRAADAALAGALPPKAPRAGALESHWYHSAPLSMNGGWLICGHMSWNVGLAIQDVVAAKLIDAANVAVPNWAALFLRRSFGVKPFLEARLGEVEKLYPLAKVLFTGYFYDWPEEYRKLFEGVALAKYKHNARAVAAAAMQNYSVCT